jgi:hypothetical protein
MESIENLLLITITTLRLPLLMRMKKKKDIARARGVQIGCLGKCHHGLAQVRSMFNYDSDDCWALFGSIIFCI